MLRRFAAVIALSLALAVSGMTASAFPPANDDFAAAEEFDVFSENEYLSAAASEATTEAGENPCASHHSVWYTFTLEASSELSFYALGQSSEGTTWPIPTVEVHVGLYQQGAPDPSLLRCDVGGTAHDVSYRQALDAGTYYLQIGATPGTTPEYYYLVVGPPPANDTATTAMPVPPDGVYVSSRGSLASSGDGDHTCADRHSRWYTFTFGKRSDLNVFVNTPGIGLQLLVHSTIGIYKSDSGQLSLVKCQTGGAPFADGYDILFTETLDAGTYYLQVGVANQPPNWTLLLLSATPANDNLGKAAALEFPVNDRKSAMLASFQSGSEPGAQAGCSMPLHHSIWYKFTLDESRVLDLNALNSEIYIYPDEGGTVAYPPYIDVWKKNGSSLQPVDCDGKSVIRKKLSPGTYLIRLASPVKLQRRWPSSFSLIGAAEPLGLPYIHDQPDREVYANSGGTATLSVMATGDAPLSYQWYFGEPGNTSQPVPGATGSVLVFSPISNSWVWVRVTNPIGSRDSAFGTISIVYLSRHELLENGDFEDGLSSWTLQSGSSDKVACGTGSHPPQGHGSSCAFVFKGGAGESASLKQTVQAFYPQTRALTLSFMMKTVGSVKPLSVTVKVTHENGQPPTLTKLRYVKTSGEYARLSENRFLLSLPAQVKRVTLTFKHTSQTGKTFIDDVSLLDEEVDFRRDIPLPPPAAPPGFRSP